MLLLLLAELLTGHGSLTGSPGKMKLSFIGFAVHP